MNLLFYVSLAIVVLLLIALIIYAYHFDTGLEAVLAVISIVSITFLLLGFIYKTDSNPTALDVYRGNTTLEITYRDSIPVDTIVVYKY